MVVEGMFFLEHMEGAETREPHELVFAVSTSWGFARAVRRGGLGRAVGRPLWATAVGRLGAYSSRRDQGPLLRQLQVEGVLKCCAFIREGGRRLPVGPSVRGCPGAAREEQLFWVDSLEFVWMDVFAFGQ